MNRCKTESIGLKRTDRLKSPPIFSPAAMKIRKITDFTQKEEKASVKLEKELSEPAEIKKDIDISAACSGCKLRIIKGDNLLLRYGKLFSGQIATSLLQRCEQELVYNTGDLAKVKIFGKLIDIPRKQVAHGDAGLTYSFSGNTIPALPWTPLLTEIKSHIERASGFEFNFVLINRYKDGMDYMGEHKDDEKDLCEGYPIASLSLGQSRDFVFRHQDNRSGSGKRKRPGGTSSTSGSSTSSKSQKLDPVSILLEHGSLLLMEAPTNSFWYHSLPRRARALGIRLNMTFRRMEPANCKPCKKTSGTGT